MQKCILKYIKCLKDQKVIAFPTDTVWGLSVDALNLQAIDNLINIKKRKLNKSFSVLISSVDKLNQYAILSDFEKLLVKEIWPGSFSIVFKAKDLNWAKQLGSQNGSIAFRCINNKFTKNLLNKWGGALITTSANSSGSKVCNNSHDILKLSPDIKICSYFINFVEKLNTPSTVIKVLDKKIKILRNSYQYDLLKEIAAKKNWTLNE